MKSIKDWMKLVHDNAVSKGFWDSDKDFIEIKKDQKAKISGYLITPEQYVRYMVEGDQVVRIALAITELSEAIEAIRSGNPPDDKVPKHSALAVELGDAVIRIWDLAGKLGIDLEKVISDKHEFNTKRPHKHGRKL